MFFENFEFAYKCGKSRSFEEMPEVHALSFLTALKLLEINLHYIFVALQKSFERKEERIELPDLGAVIT